MKPKRKIYLDTSVISHLDAQDVPEKMADTWKLWYILEQGTEFEVVTSTVTQAEIAKCREPKKSRMVRWLTSIDYQVISETPKVLALANDLLLFGVLSQKHREDILHIACAVIARCDSIISWNFTHFVNANTIGRVNAACDLYGYPPVEIVSPSMLIIKGDENE